MCRSLPIPVRAVNAWKMHDLAPPDGHHVEPPGFGLQGVLGKIRLGAARHRLELLRRDRRFRIPELIRAPGLHLHEHDLALILAHEVDLPERGAHLTTDDLAPLSGQKIRGGLLTLVPEGPPRIHTYGRYFSFSRRARSASRIAGSRLSAYQAIQRTHASSPTIQRAYQNRSPRNRTFS